jgi:hypothetical protein
LAVKCGGFCLCVCPFYGIGLHNEIVASVHEFKRPLSFIDSN